jgi:hypothetical protein
MTDDQMRAERRKVVARIVDPEAFNADPEILATKRYGNAGPSTVRLAKQLLASRQEAALAKAEALSVGGGEQENGSSQSQPKSTLHGAHTEAEPSAWQPIETAPRDGTHILVTEAGGGGLGHCGPLNEHGFRELADWCDVVHWFNDPEAPGFYSTSWGFDQSEPFAELTHWQPLPTPPVEGEGS